MSNSDRRAAPWGRPEHVCAGALNLLGLLALAGCWRGAALEDRWQGQLTWVQSSIVVALVVVVANALWLIRGFLSVKVRKRDLMKLTRPRAATLATSRAESSDGSSFVAGPRMLLYHRPSCSLAAGKTVSAVDAGAGERQPCRMCQP